MSEKNERLVIVCAGAAIGVIAALLVYLGNPMNMGFCIACFIRDTVGGLGLHRAAAVQYIRPEIVGLVLGSLVMALVGREWQSRGGSSPMTRFVLGFCAMVGCLMFLGCPFRMILRIAGGDLNAVVGLVGFACGIAGGTFFLNRGYSLGRTRRLHASEGVLWPVAQVALLALLVAAPAFIFFSEAGAGPGAQHAARRPGAARRFHYKVGIPPVRHYVYKHIFALFHFVLLLPFKRLFSYKAFFRGCAAYPVHRRYYRNTRPRGSYLHFGHQPPFKFGQIFRSYHKGKNHLLGLFQPERVQNRAFGSAVRQRAERPAYPVRFEKFRKMHRIISVGYNR